MTGWDTVAEAWVQAKTIAEEMGGDHHDLVACARLYMDREWPDGDRESPKDLSEAVAVLERLNLLRDYLTEVLAARSNDG